MDFVKRGTAWVWMAAGMWLLQCAPALADTPPSGSAPERAAYGPNFDWIGHTRQTLDELKVKLNLAAGQAAAWDAWSAGVLKDAQQQLEQKKPWLEEKPHAAKRAAEETTPERMAREIERLRAQSTWMQEHLVQLEAALTRTKTFYDGLDRNQKTIFDLYWHEVHHRAAGHDHGLGTHEWHGEEQGAPGKGGN